MKRVKKLTPRVLKTMIAEERQKLARTMKQKKTRSRNTSSNQKLINELALILKIKNAQSKKMKEIKKLHEVKKIT